jgi:hypothetical protein
MYSYVVTVNEVILFKKKPLVTILISKMLGYLKSLARTAMVAGK